MKILLLPLLCVLSLPLAAAELPTINVTGLGSVEVVPDMATLELSVVSEADTAAAALAANSAAMAKVLAALREAGIAERDLQTSQFAIQPRYARPDRNQPGEGPRITGYNVRNALAVRVRELDALGEVIDRAVKLGVNQGGEISFGVADPAAAITRARALAVADARQKAETLATAAGVQLGALQQLSEHGGMPRPQPMARMAAMADYAEAVPVAIGETAYQVEVSASWAVAR